MTGCTYEWDFGDGIFNEYTTNGGTAQFTYEEGGLYTAILRVTDDDSAIGVNSVEVDVQVLQPWRTEIVDSAGTQGWWTSIALDSGEHPGISYICGDSGRSNLKYAYNAGTGWTYKDIELAGGNELYATSVAFDPNDNPCISYTHFATDGDLKYAVKDTGNWYTYILDSQGATGNFNSLAFDLSGNPAISYYDDSNKCLRFARSNGANWHFETVDGYPGHTMGYYTSLAFDSHGNPGISYISGISGASNLKYAYFNSSSWRIEDIELAGGMEGYTTSLNFDSLDNPHISYTHYGTSGDLHYTSKNNGIWTIEVVVQNGAVGFWNSLALDGQDNPHICYYDDTYGDLKYARRIGGQWALETVDSAGIVGKYCSLALDSSGNPHISYHDQTNGDLKYAWLR